MKAPDVRNPINDSEADITYNVMAYRKLSRAEIVQAVSFYTAQRGRKKLKRGTTVTILTIIGANE